MSEYDEIKKLAARREAQMRIDSYRKKRDFSDEPFRYYTHYDVSFSSEKIE